MTETEGLGNIYPPTAVFSSYTLGGVMGSSDQSLYDVQGDKGFAAFAGGGISRLKNYLEGRLDLDIEDPEAADELDLEGVVDLMYALGTEMGANLDMAVWAQQRIDPDRAVTLIW